MSDTQLTVDQVTGLIGSLYDTESFAKEIESSVDNNQLEVLATYKDADADGTFAISCELSLANSLGAALTKIPPGSAQEATGSGEVPETIADNLHEVLNICSSIFAEIESHRVVLDKMYLPGQDVEAELTEQLKASDSLLQLNYELDRYQAGKLALLKLS